jgi:8-oxo-dGTP diphosphatase
MRNSPKLTVDGILRRAGGIILIRRKNPPFRGCYALPGGFVEHGETVESAVVREFYEETGLRTKVKSLVGVYSEPDRDPRGHTVTVVFELDSIGGKLKGGDDAAEAKVFPIDALPELAFDHAKILFDYLNRNRFNDG